MKKISPELVAGVRVITLKGEIDTDCKGKDRHTPPGTIGILQHADTPGHWSVHFGDAAVFITPDELNDPAQYEFVNDPVNTILVFEDNGVVKHRLCTEEQGKAALRHAAEQLSGGSMMTSDVMDAEMVYSVSPDLRNRVESAKCKLRDELKLRDAMNKHGVPKDREIRASVCRAFNELRSQSVLSL